jgi:transposase-like protein
MDLPRRLYSRELKRAVMLEMDAGSSSAQAARKYQLNPKLLEKWRCDWRARSESRALSRPGRRS